MSRLKYRLTDSRWNWFVRGLPSVRRAWTLYLARDYTMTSFVRCRTLWDLSCSVLSRNIPGAFVECGVWRGGSAGIMGRAIESSGKPRLLHLFDSFEGLPEPGPEDGNRAVEYSGGKGSGRLESVARCEASLDTVRSFLFNRLKLEPKQVQFHVGWFQNTIPPDSKQLGPIAVLRLDGDWYASTQVCLEHLYPLLSPGGVLILDDYNCWEGCKKATDEYRQAQQIDTPIVQLDADCSYWIKD
jgi:O-methyltransferase